MQKMDPDAIAIILAILVAILNSYSIYEASSTPYFTGFLSFGGWDQVAYNAIAVSMKYRIFPITEPLTDRYLGYYPPIYFFIIAQISNITGVAVPYIWNYLMLPIMPALFFIAMYYFIKKLFGPKVGIGAASICSFVGTYEALLLRLQDNQSNYWYHTYELHSVIWPPFVSMHSPSAESFALVMTVMCFYFTAKFITEQKNRDLLLASVFAAAVFTSHMFVAIFLGATLLLLMYVHTILEMTKKKGLSSVLPMLIPPLASLLFIASYQLIPFTLIVMAAGLFFAFSYFYGRDLAPVRSAGNILVISAILSSFYLVQIADQFFNGSGAAGYEYVMRTETLSVPPVPYLENLGVLIICAVAGLYVLHEKKSPYFSYFLSMFLAGVLLSNNAYFNINYQPYRFITYFFIPLAILTAVAVFYLLGKKDIVSKLLGLFIVILLLVSLETNFIFLIESNEETVFFHPDVYNGISWLKNNTKEYEVVASDSHTSFFIRAYAENKGVVPYGAFTAANNYDEASNDLDSMMSRNTSTATRYGLVEKYNISYVFIWPGNPVISQDYMNNLTMVIPPGMYNFSSDSGFELVYRSNNMSIFKVLNHTP